MAWQDRPYYRDDSDSGRMNPLLWLVAGSVPLFTIFGIRVRAHAALIVTVALVFLFGLGEGASSASARVQFITMLFAIVLLHEFGHCFAARYMGGEANDILMTPIGGLAFAMAPRKPWPTFVTVAAGPAVNVVICLLCGFALYWIVGVFPLGPWSFSRAFDSPLTEGWANVGSYLLWIYTISYSLLLFNLLPVFPLDGGQMLQAALWRPYGYYRSMLWTMNVGIVGGALMIAYGIITFGSLWGGLLLVFIGLSCLLTCQQTRRMLIAEGPWAFADEDGPDFSASLQPEKRPNQWLARRRANREKKLMRAEAAERARVDAILDKVARNGMNSLNWSERRALRKATEHQRKRDAELRNLRSR
jgi:stage IV sporulation protein FB